MIIIEQLQSTKFTEDEKELAEIRNKIIHKIENGRGDYYFNIKDYEKLLRHYIGKNDEKSLSAMISPAMIQSLQSSRFTFSEKKYGQKLKDVQFQQLIECVQDGDVKNSELLLKISSWCASNINKELFFYEVQAMAPGASLLHLALGHGNAEMASMLIAHGANLYSVDYYDNSALHYAGKGGKNTYEYVLHFDLLSNPNIFGHTPEDYLKHKGELEIIMQSELTDKFIDYIKLNHYDEKPIYNDIKGSDLIEDIDGGMCSGDGFIRAMSVLRGEASSTLYEKMSEVIRKWDGTMQGLDKPLEDTILAKEFSNLRDVNYRAVFEYMMSVIIASQEYLNIPILDTEKGDRAAMLELLNENEDKLACLKKSDKKMLSRDNVKHELGELLKHPCRMIQIGLGDISIDQFSHEIYIVTDKNNNLFFIDSNTPYRIAALKNNAESLDKMIKIMFSYFNQIENMTTYEYSAGLDMKMKPR